MQREDASRGDAAANHPALCFRDVALNQVARHGQQGRKGERNDKCLLIRQGGKEKEHVEKMDSRDVAMRKPCRISTMAFAHRKTRPVSFLTLLSFPSAEFLMLATFFFPLGSGQSSSSREVRKSILELRRVILCKENS